MEQKSVIGYCRVSTLEQQKKGFGIDIQKHDIERYARERGWHIAAFYSDEGRSGIDERRKALQRLLRDCRVKAIEVVVIASLDRPSRSLRFAENLFYEFERLGVKVCIADMPHYDGSDRKEVLIRQIKAAIAEENRKEIIERLQKGREERSRKGKMSGGNIAYGYARKSGNAVIDEEEARIVKTIFALQADGLNDAQIADALNARGYQRRNGKSWTQRRVWAIRHRKPLYCQGIVKYGKAAGKNESLILLDT